MTLKILFHTDHNQNGGDLHYQLQKDFNFVISCLCYIDIFCSSKYYKIYEILMSIVSSKFTEAIIEICHDYKVDKGESHN